MTYEKKDWIMIGEAAYFGKSLTCCPDWKTTTNKTSTNNIMNVLINNVTAFVFFPSLVQFAGSLGKLTVSSVNNPRKMIDAVVTTRTDDEVRKSS